MSPINDQPPPHPSSSNSQTHNPRFGQTRCHWILLTEDLQFLYIDPVFRTHLGPQAQSIIGRSLLEFIHPDEQSSAQSDLRKVIDSRTLHGTITRVCYTRLGRARTRLGFRGTPTTLSDEDKASYNEDYITCDLVLNLAADNLVLCFIHAAVDISPADNNEIHRTFWTNWCGTPEIDIEEINRLYRALAPISQSYSGSSPPSRIFQILKNTSDRSMLLSWPTHGYDPQEFQRLVHHVQIEDCSSSNAKTSCTRRYKTFQNLSPSNDWIREVESGFVPYGQIIFACHKSMPFRHRTSFSSYPQSSQTYEVSGHAYYPPSLAHQTEGFSGSDSFGYHANHSAHIAQTTLLPSERLNSTPPPDMVRHYQHFDVQNSWHTPSPSPTPQALPTAKQYIGQRQASTYGDSVPTSPQQRDTRSHSEEAAGSSRDAYSTSTTPSTKGNPPAGVTRCAACKSVSSPEWRKGPSGKKDLCNACGLRYSRAKAKKEGVASRRRRGPVIPDGDVTANKRRSSDEGLNTLSPDNSQQRLVTLNVHPSSQPREFTFLNSHSYPPSHSIPASPTSHTYTMEPRLNSMHIYSHSTASGGVTYPHTHHPPSYHHNHVNSPSYHDSPGSPVSGDMSHSVYTMATPPSSYVRGLSSEHRDSFHTRTDQHYNLH